MTDSSVSSSSNTRRDYLVAYRWLRLGVRLPLRLDLEAPEHLQSAFVAFGARRRPDPFAVPLCDRAWFSPSRHVGLARHVSDLLGVNPDDFGDGWLEDIADAFDVDVDLDDFPPAAGPAAPVPAGLPAPATAQVLISAPVQPDPAFCACGGAL